MPKTVQALFLLLLTIVTGICGWLAYQKVNKQTTPTDLSIPDIVSEY